MSTRRSKRVKNLEEEVESIFSQDESDEDSKVVLTEDQKSARSPHANDILKVTTPTRERQTVLLDMVQTPRRSCRKSVKPAQDYDEIVTRSLRSCTRLEKKALSAESENEENNDDGKTRPRWTPAKVGRVSQKRGRKTKRVEKGKSQNDVIVEQRQEDTCSDKIEESIEAEKELEISEKPSFDDNLVETKEQLDEASANMPCLNYNQELVNEQKMEEHHNCTDINIILESHSPSLQLIQGDSEDDYESTEKSESEEICIMYEKNISNNSNAQSSSPESIASVDKDNSFGSYLKSKEINIADLGLNPINVDDKDDNYLTNEITTSTKETEEMPSLIICDDDDEINFKQTGILNETFEAIEDTEIECRQKENEEVMEVLQLSDDDSGTPRKYPRIILTDTSAQNHILLSKATKGSPIRATMSKKHTVRLPSTPKQSIAGSAIKSKKLSSAPNAVTPKLPRTPQQSKKQYRLPTPYRNRNFKFDDESKENIRKTPSKSIPNSSLISLTTLEPKEIVLSGIRKRSLSVCINEPPRHNLLAQPLGNQKKNRMVSFHSPANQTTLIDDLDTIIAKSLKKTKPQENESSNKFVTTRRKRSLSFDESLMSASMASKLPRPVVQNVVNKTKNPTSSNSLKRTKLPNFAAIHERQFKKMESLVDHVSRKQERSKNLINSATKLMSASAQKNNMPLNKSINNKDGGRSRALKKIDLNPKSQKIEKPDLKKKSTMPTKPAFNMSTSLIVKPTAPISSFAEKVNTSRLYQDNKMESRLQRHMELFKGRAASAKAGKGIRKNEVILKGVRSNRRFELQMQHRKNLEQ